MNEDYDGCINRNYIRNKSAAVTTCYIYHCYNYFFMPSQINIMLQKIHAFAGGANISWTHEFLQMHCKVSNQNQCPFNHVLGAFVGSVSLLSLLVKFSGQICVYFFKANITLYTHPTWTHGRSLLSFNMIYYFIFA